MKRFLVVLLALAVAGGAFAADAADGFKITGEVKTGVAIFAQTDGVGDKGDVWAVARNDDYGGAFRGRVGLSWEGDIGGTQVRFQSENKDFAKIATGFGWLNLFNKKFQIYAGQDIWDKYGVGGVVDKNADGLDGLRLEVHPVTGLDLYYAVKTSSDSGYLEGSLLNLLRQSRWGAKYANDKVTVQAIFKLDGYEGEGWHGPDDATIATLRDLEALSHGVYLGSGLSSDYDPWQDDLKALDKAKKPVWGSLGVANTKDTYLQAAFGVKVPVGPAKIDLTAAFGTVEDSGWLRVGPKVEFASGKINAWGLANMQFALGDYLPMGDWANGAGVEDYDDAIVGFEAGFGYQITDLLKAELALGSDNAAWFEGNGLWIKPKVAFSFGPNVEFALFDKISNIGADKDKSGSKANSTDGFDAAALKNQLQIEIVWKF